jgi:hypothetical protein
VATTLADINATLGATNIGIAAVAKDTKKTSTGITNFLKYLEDKKADDLENTREEKAEKKASIIDSASKVGSSTRSGLESIAKSGKGMLSGLSKFIPAAATGFLSAMLGSKFFRFGLAGLGLTFADELAKYISGPEASKEFTSGVSMAIKGGAIGSIFGFRFGLIGAAVGALLNNKKVDEELGKLVKNLENFSVRFPKFAGFFSGIGDAVGSGLESVNKLLDGTSENTFKDIGKSLLLLGGIATLLMPGKMLGLLFGATKLMLSTPAGAALLAIAGGGIAINSLIGGNPTDAAGFGLSTLATGATYGAYKYATRTKPPLSGSPSVPKGSPSVPKGSPSVPKGNSPQLDLFKDASKNKQPRNLFKSMIDLVKNGGRHAMSMVRGLPVLLPLAAVAGLTYVLNNKESSEKLARADKAEKVSGTTTKESKEFFKGTTSYMDDTIGAKILTEFRPGQYRKGAGIEKDTSDLKNFFQQSNRLKKLAKESSIDGGLYAAAASNNPQSSMKAGSSNTNIDASTINSNNISNAAVFGGSDNVMDFGDQILAKAN